MRKQGFAVVFGMLLQLAAGTFNSTPSESYVCCCQCIEVLCNAALRRSLMWHITLHAAIDVLLSQLFTVHYRCIQPAVCVVTACLPASAFLTTLPMSLVIGAIDHRSGLICIINVHIPGDMV